MDRHPIDCLREPPLFSLIFPAYNPGAVAGKTWLEVQDFLRATEDAWEIIFVCDGCSDGSAERLTEWSRPFSSSVRVLSYVPNRGKGYAVRQGLMAARGTWRIFTDIDLAYGIEDVGRVARELRAGAEVAIASRTHPLSRVLMPARLHGYAYRRHLQSMVFSRLVRMLLPLNQEDTQAGLKGMSAQVAERIVPLLRCNGFGFDCELLTACAHYGLPVLEVPVNVHYEDRASTTNLGAMGSMLGDIWRIRRRWHRAPKVLPGLPVERDRRQAA